jgi:uncharacterized protein (DUF4415 family)
MNELLRGSFKASNKKQVVYRLDGKVVDEFRETCKKYNLKQVSIIENAMREIIKEFKNEKQ